jgi:poly(3-hydroxybutyrate) depolymerase
MYRSASMDGNIHIVSTPVYGTSNSGGGWLACQSACAAVAAATKAAAAIASFFTFSALVFLLGNARR